MPLSFMQKSSSIAIIGCGNMGRSLIGGLVAGGHPAERLRGADPDAAQRERVRGSFHIQVVADNPAAIAGAEVVILAVKPQAMKATVSGAAMALRGQRPLIISIAAGIRLAAIERWIGAELPIVRAMPNTPALVGAGAAALCANARVDAGQKQLATAVLESVGLAVWLEDEDLLDVVTALSGSGPAYFFAVMEALETAAADLGLPAEQARRLTAQTALGAARMALDGPSDPACLRRQVTSPGGTTERAMHVLERGGLKRLLGDAVRAARQRSSELADTFGEE